jgi:5'-3' exonuclease
MSHISRIESAVLSGTDYNHSIYGIGIRRAVKQIYTKKDMNKVVEYLRGVKPYCDRVP